MNIHLVTLLPVSFHLLQGRRTHLKAGGAGGTKYQYVWQLLTVGGAIAPLAAPPLIWWSISCREPFIDQGTVVIALEGVLKVNRVPLFLASSSGIVLWRQDMSFFAVNLDSDKWLLPSCWFPPVLFCSPNYQVWTSQSQWKKANLLQFVMFRTTSSL